MIGNSYHKARERNRRESLRQREQRQRATLNLKSELARFWIHCNKSDMTPGERLSRLIEFAGIAIVKTTIRARRVARSSFMSCARPRGKRCFVCLGYAHLRHHIIQLQHGGSNHRLNIVDLCNGCHALIHPWLVKYELSPPLLEEVSVRTDKTLTPLLANKSPSHEGDRPTEKPVNEHGIDVHD